jgi:hypothetical protein
MTTPRTKRPKAEPTVEEPTVEETPETIVEIAEPVAAEPSEQATTPPSGGRTLVYKGDADVFQFGALRIRPGEPFTVTAEDAEDLLTYPRERFEEVSQE